MRLRRLPTPFAAPSRGRLFFSALAAAAVAACGGGGGGGDTPRSAAPTTLSGVVAVGAPISDGTLRVLDATGAVVVENVALNADGSYPAVTLTGPAPYRIEACGYAAANYQCHYSVAQGPGTAHVTPLTTATLLLAADAAPADLMTGAASGLDAAAVDAAQRQLREGLAEVLASSGAPADLDLIAGDLQAGSRTGQDRVLDSVAVATGQDGGAFVQVTPRLGTGNLYLQPGTTAGQLQVAAGAADVSLEGLDALFNAMSDAMASASACAAAGTGLAAQMASNARLAWDAGVRLQGPTETAAALCGFFGEAEIWGARLMSPTLGLCDVSGAQPMCGVTFVLRLSDGSVQSLGGGTGVTKEAGSWKFLGDRYPVSISASARAQRDRRVDGVTPVDSYARAIAVDISALPGLRCAKVSQRDADQAEVTVAYYKPYASEGVPRLSLWTANGVSTGASLNPLVGALRSADDSWLMLPQGDEGDAVVRNFFRGGRAIRVSLYSDASCSTALVVEGRSAFDIEIDGVPPVWAAMASLPWPDLTDAARQALMGLSLDSNASATFDASWLFSRGPLGVDEITVCGDRASCGEGGGGRIGQAQVRAGSTAATIELRNEGAPIAAGASKMLALGGRTGDGVALQSNHLVCTAQAAGEVCR